MLIESDRHLRRELSVVGFTSLSTDQRVAKIEKALLNMTLPDRTIRWGGG